MKVVVNYTINSFNFNMLTDIIYAKRWLNKKILLSVIQCLSLINPISSTEYQRQTCIFNPSCTCSRSSDSNLGTVSCTNVPLYKLPSYIHGSKLNRLILQNNQLLTLDHEFLKTTGAHMIIISNNPIHHLYWDALKGLENSLQDLELSYLKLSEPPKEAIYNLKKLQILNLSGNKISDVSSSNWLNVRNTLEKLILKDNVIAYVPKNSFENFCNLKLLDLSSNVISSFHPQIFIGDTTKITHLYFGDNQIRCIPYEQLQYLKNLRHLDLSYNFVSKIDALCESIPAKTEMTKLSLNVLNLKYNNIETLFSNSFQEFSSLNVSYFDGNPILEIQNGTFKNLRISELSFSGCGIELFHAGMITGLERSLVLLDMSYNSLEKWDATLISNFIVLQELKLFGNKIHNLEITDKVPRAPLYILEFSGTEKTNNIALFRDISKIETLMKIVISNVKILRLSATLFVEYGYGIEELSIRNAQMNTIHEQTFEHLRFLKKLDLSNNKLENIHENTFRQISHSLSTMNLANAFSDSLKEVPYSALIHLSSLKILDISNNKFEKLPTETLYNMKNLEVFRSHDCQLKTLEPETFSDEIHTKLMEITFSYNLLEILKRSTFEDLIDLRYVNIEDNFIKMIETHAFKNLKNLKWIYLRGNKIEEIQLNAFTNLPELELLDLAYNNLINFDFSFMDQMVAYSSLLTINITHNQLDNLLTNSNDIEKESGMNIHILDLSYNNINDIANDFFNCLEYSLHHLYLSHNFLTQLKHNVFRNLAKMHTLDVSFNRIQIVEQHCFVNMSKIQILNFTANEIHGLPPNLFHGINRLRIVDLSQNKLFHLPDFSFREDSLEFVNLANNLMSKILSKWFSPEVANSLRKMDISSNRITEVKQMELHQFKSLQSLNLAKNFITTLEDSAFSHLKNLLILDLSYNYKISLMKSAQKFSGIEDNLINLSLNNLSLSLVPYLPFPKLEYLSLSNNNISKITADTIMKISALRVLDLSHNNLLTLPIILLSMKNLQFLNLSSNNISILSENSVLDGFSQLNELDITKLPLNTFEPSLLSGLRSLRTLHIGTFTNVDRFNIPSIINRNFALTHLHIDVSLIYLNEEMHGILPQKLKKITLSGYSLNSLNDDILMGVYHPTLNLVVQNTNLGEINPNLFKNLFRVRNITVDIRHNFLKQMFNPSTAEIPNLFNRTYLTDIYVSHNPLICDCGIGWIETWQRRYRQVTCSDKLMNLYNLNHACLMTDDDLREANCDVNKGDLQSLVQIMKTELECSWSGTSRVEIMKIEYVIIVSLTYILIEL